MNQIDINDSHYAEDELHEECGVFGVYDFDGNDVSSTIYYGLFALQHRGQPDMAKAVVVIHAVDQFAREIPAVPVCLPLFFPVTGIAAIVVKTVHPHPDSIGCSVFIIGTAPDSILRIAEASRIVRAFENNPCPRDDPVFFRPVHEDQKSFKIICICMERHSHAAAIVRTSGRL